MDYERGELQKDHYGPGDLVEVPCPDCGGRSFERLSTEYGDLGIVRCADLQHGVRDSHEHVAQYGCFPSSPAVIARPAP